MTGIIKNAKALLAAVLSVALLATAMPAMAQEVPPEQLALARKYVDLTDHAGIYEITLVEIGIDTMRDLLQQNPEIAQQIDAVVGKVVESYATRKGELLDQFARVYASRFTTEELQTIVTFYETPTGQKLSQANADVNKDLQAVLQVFTNNTRSEFFAKVRAELRSEGLTP